MYAKGSGTAQQDLEWHLVVNMFAGDGTVATACGYPEMPDIPRHSGRFQPQAMASHPISDICEKCNPLPEPKVKRMNLSQLITDFNYVRRRANQKLPVVRSGNRVWFDYEASGANEFSRRIGRLPRWLRWLALKTAVK